MNVKPTNSKQQFEYILTVLPKTSSGQVFGNARVSFADLDKNVTIDPNTEILQTQSYYPFWLTHSGLQSPQSGKENLYQFNGAELNQYLKIYETTFRQYDPTIGRWTSLDPITHFEYSPYNAFDNNPILFSDPSGSDSEESMDDILKEIWDKSTSEKTVWTNNNDGTITSDDGQSVDCKSCLKGGDYDGQNFDDIKTGEIMPSWSPTKVNISKSELSWIETDDLLENQITFLEFEKDVISILGIATGASVGSEALSKESLKTLYKLWKNSTTIKEFVSKSKKIISPRNAYMLGLGLALTLERSKAKMQLKQVHFIDQNNKFEFAINSNILIITQSTIHNYGTGVMVMSKSNYYVKDTKEFIGSITYF